MPLSAPASLFEHSRIDVFPPADDQPVFEVDRQRIVSAMAIARCVFGVLPLPLTDGLITASANVLCYRDLRVFHSRTIVLSHFYRISVSVELVAAVDTSLIGCHAYGYARRIRCACARRT